MKKILISVVFLLTLASTAVAEGNNLFNKGRATSGTSTVEDGKALLKESVSKIRNERIKKVSERIVESVLNLNKRLPSHFEEVLGKLSLILDRIAERADKFAERGVDVSSVRTEIGEARTAIAEATKKVEEQKNRVYSINLTDEQAVRAAMRDLKDKLRDDLKALRDVVFGARKAVYEAAVALGKLGKKGSSTSTPSTSTTE